MLAEIAEVRQVEGEGYRRWFTDPDFDLIVWYETAERSHVLGFQLCYDKRRRERCVTWRESGSVQHHLVDDGENPFSAKMTPVLVSDGIFDGPRVLDAFLRAAENVDEDLRRLVEHALLRDGSGES
jgi:hypothetical protein